MQGVRSKEEHEKIITTVKEIEEFIGMRKAKPLSEEEEEELQATISEFEKLYG